MEPKYFYDVQLLIEPNDSAWVSDFRDIMCKKEIGKIDGDISRKSGKKIFTSSNSELNEDKRGRGLGLLMYELTIAAVLNAYPNVEFRSSTNLNTFSKGVWKALTKKYYNVEDKGSYFSVNRNGDIL